jgi:hypothetical protein
MPMILEQSAIGGSAAGMVDHRSPPEAKIALFRALFRGREDVYPRRFESRKTGKAGYQPVCGNEWVRGVCEKPRIKCNDCLHQRFLSIADEVVRWHLSGQDNDGKDFVMGIYPMLVDETCFFLAADFDKEGWQEDAKAFWDTCRRLNIPAALERSRSGNGAHVWLFFDQAISASLARKLGSHILTETMERRPDVGLNSYDRFFPNQDTLPKGGFGNLIALPLQKRPREAATACSSMSTSFLTPTNGRSYLRSSGSIGLPSRSSFIVLKRWTELSECGMPQWTRMKRRLGPCRLHAAGRSFRLLVLSHRAWSWFSATKSTLPKMYCRLDCVIGFFDWPHSRTPNSTKPKRCDCRHTISLESLRALRIILIISACRGAAWTMYKNSYAI